jgi:hypothetical protein
MQRRPLVNPIQMPIPKNFSYPVLTPVSRDPEPSTKIEEITEEDNDNDVFLDCE